MKIEVQIFNVIEVTVDFTGSENIKVGEKDKLKCTVEAQPFVKTYFVKVKLRKNWSLKYVFFINKKTPSIEL